MPNKDDVNVMTELLEKVSNLDPEEAKKVLHNLKHTDTTDVDDMDDALMRESFDFANEKFWELVTQAMELDLDKGCVSMELLHEAVGLKHLENWTLDEILQYVKDAYVHAEILQDMESEGTDTLTWMDEMTEAMKTADVDTPDQVLSAKRIEELISEGMMKLPLFDHGTEVVKSEEKGLWYKVEYLSDLKHFQHSRALWMLRWTNDGGWMKLPTDKELGLDDSN